MAARQSAILAALCCLLGLGSASLALADHFQQKLDRAAAGWPLADFELTDQRGAPFTRDNLQGRWTLLLLENEPCEAPCEAALRALAGLFQRIQSTQAVRAMQVVLVSPQRDEPPGKLGQYVESHDPRFLSARGPRATWQGLADDLGVAGGSRYRGTSGLIWLIGPDGIVRVQFLPPYNVPLLTAEVLKIRARR